jgi:prepilin-type processing-associated H-X9-DG protein
MSMGAVAVDERLTEYAREQWSDLLRYARQLCPDADEDEAREVVLETLTRVASRWRILRDRRDPDVAVRRTLTKVCINRGSRVDGGGDYQLMDVRFIDSDGALDQARPLEPTELVRNALAELPPRQRVALVLTHLDDVSESRSAALMGCSVETVRGLAAAGFNRLRGILVDAADGQRPRHGDDLGATGSDEAGRRTEGLLRAAISEVPECSPAPEIPVVELDRRVRRRWQRRVAVATAVAVAVGVAAMWTLTRPPGAASTGAGHHLREPRFASNPGSIDRSAVARLEASAGAVLLPEPPTNYASAVTAGGGFLWTIEIHATRHGSRSVVVKRNPRSGTIVARISVPASDDDIAFGLGHVWTWSTRSDSATTAMAVIDPASGDVEQSRTTPPVAIANAAFADGHAWFTEPAAGAVEVIAGARLGSAVREKIDGARFVVPFDSHHVLVAGQGGELHELPGDVLVDPDQTGLTLLSTAPDYGIWLAGGNRIVYLPNDSSSPSVSLTLPHPVGSVTGDPAHGVYIALKSKNPAHNDPYLVYYSPTELATATDPLPSATLDGFEQAEGMVANPTGGVVFVSNEGAIDSWDPELPGGRR